MDFSYEEIVILHESNSIENPYKQLTGCLFSCASHFWLVRSTLVDKAVRGLHFDNPPLTVLRSAVRCERPATSNVNIGMRLQIECDNVNRTSPLNDRRMRLAASLNKRQVRTSDSRLESCLISPSVKILAMVCHFYPGLDWNRLGIQGTLVPTI